MTFISFVSDKSSSSPCWFVGAMTGGDDQTDRFIDEGIWEHDFDDNSRVLTQVRTMQTGERIAIKAATRRKVGLIDSTDKTRRACYS
jgi:5-methylcytosine-specific restriction protein B